MPALPLPERRPEILLAVILSTCLVALSLQVRRPDGRTVGERWLLSAAGPAVWAIAELRSGLGDVAGWARTRERLLGDNRALVERVGTLEGEVLRLRDAERERERLLALLGTVPDPPAGTRAARLIALEPAGPFRAGLLDRGAADGIEFGAVVVAKDGLIGRVVETGAHTSRVQLLSDRSAAVGVLVAKGARAAVARGDGAGRVTVQYVPILVESDLGNGDLVVTSGTDGVYPPRLPVGRIVEVRHKVLFLEIGLVLAVDPARESVVFVLPPRPRADPPAPPSGPASAAAPAAPRTVS